VESLENYRRLWQDEQRRRADYHLFWPGRAYQEEQSILIAGCGTSQAAKHALRWPSAQVTGIDFSATSVRHTLALKRKYRLDNLQVHQLAVERIAELGMSFDQIVCTGVVHHLPDPEAGLKALCSALKADGAMHLMVYAPYGRAGVYMLQEFCRRTGIQPGAKEIRELMVALTALPPGHPLQTLLHEAPEIRQEAELADALLHPQDRAYTVAQFFDFIERCGLVFARWVRQAPYSARCGVIARLPQAARIAQLPEMEQFAAIELFRGTMVRHSAVLYRNDCPGVAQPVDFTGETWIGYVPMRMADTICIQEKLPPGAAAVLINQTHTYRDLVMPIDAKEKRFFDAIDGKRTCGAILEKTLPATPKKPEIEAARSFFERLWWYDEVVFDTLPQSGRNIAPADAEN
jgi:SAM-dependent methyltransferase